MLQARRFFESVLTALILTFSTFGAIWLTTKLFGDRCWPQRYGGILVGVAVFFQGYVYANEEYFSKPSKYGLTREKRVMHQVYVVTILGTGLWTMGDFMHSLYGLTMCHNLGGILP